MFHNNVCREAEFVGAAAVVSGPFPRPRFFLSSSLCSLSWEVYLCEKNIHATILVYMIYPVGPLGKKREPL